MRSTTTVRGCAVLPDQPLRVRPLTLAQANERVTAWHRHHKPVRGCRFALGAFAGEECHGVAIVGRPVARRIDQYAVAEVTRLATDGTRNVCSLLYGAVARACKAMGYQSVQTYTLPQEGGASLRAAGWVCEGETGGGDWNRRYAPARQNRRTDQPMGTKLRWRKTLNPVEVRRAA